ncbi:queuosine precursor transporter [Robinsoniella peoriensis]|uniref:queuosine precursor transporter n=1 Tax=Robinsoniella peoriensis TaxID=180332 RepID=UPI00085C38C3|nr:queuosine precursor transporter [Robinsoniella peoriensis]
MRNEILLILSVVIIYGSVLLWYKLLGCKGLMAFTVLATISANIEVLILVNAFGMEQTLGNILFASTFLVTDILSEVSGKKAANQAVNIGILTSLTFIIISQSWLLYQPGANDWAHSSIVNIFSNTPRMMAASLIVYAISQKFDVWLYHKWWGLTKRLCGDSRRYLWLRNNGSTLLSQLLNTVLFTMGAFLGTYDTRTLISIMWASYVIFIFTSLADTPAVYLARRIRPVGEDAEYA